MGDGGKRLACLLVNSAWTRQIVEGLMAQSILLSTFRGRQFYRILHVEEKFELVSIEFGVKNTFFLSSYSKTN